MRISKTVFALCLLSATWARAQSQNCQIAVDLGGKSFVVPCLSNFPIDKAQPQLDRIVIMQHGADRGIPYYQTGIEAAAKAAQNTTSLIISPKFGIREDYPSNPGNILYWTEPGWKKGDPSVNGASGAESDRISSYAVMDLLLTRLVELNPQIKKISLAGHSAGGQFFSRYGAGNQIDEKMRAQGIVMRYIIANPSSFLYLNDERWVKDSKPPRFTVPGNACPSYDSYLYGMQGLNTYMNKTGPEKIRTQFRSRVAIYLLGTQDTCDCNGWDNSCAALTQGQWRFDRGNIYHAYIGNYYKAADVYHTHKMAYAPGVGHDNTRMVGSPCGLFYIFDKGSCTTPSQTPVVVGIESLIARSKAAIRASQAGSLLRVEVPASGRYRLTLFSADGSQAGSGSFDLMGGRTSAISLQLFGPKLTPTARYLVRVDPGP
jgi:hypothetical protein